MVETVEVIVEGTENGEVVEVEAGQKIILDATSPASVSFLRIGNDLVVTWISGGKTAVLQGFFDHAGSEIPPLLGFSDGVFINASNIFDLGLKSAPVDLPSAGGGAAYQISDEISSETSTPLEIVRDTIVSFIPDSGDIANQVFILDDEEAVVAEIVNPVLADDTFTTDEDSDLSELNLSENVSSDFLPNGAATDYDMPGDVTLNLPSGVANGVFAGWVEDAGNSSLWTGVLNGYGLLTFDASDPENVKVSLDVNPTGSAVDGDSNFDVLNEGEQASIVFSYATTASLFATSSEAIVTITVDGVQDDPALSSSLTLAAVENGQVMSVDLLSQASGVDTGDVLSISNMSTLPAGLTLLGTTLTVDPTNASFDTLAEGQTTQIIVTYDVVDNNGGSTAQTATVTVTGLNDNPTVSATLATAATEGGSSFNLDLVSLASDVDTEDVLSVSNMSALPAGLSLSGTELNIDPTNTAFDSLAVGQTTQIDVTYDVVDNNGGSVAQTATITITGTNDAPVVSSALTSAATEGGGTVDLDLVSLASDVDTGDSLSLTNMSALPAGITLSGTILTTDPTDASFNSLSNGETTQIVVTYDVEDDQGEAVAQTATITVTGTNDAPTVTSALTVDAVEGGSLLYLDLLSLASDVDLNDTLSISNMSVLPAGLSLSGSVLTVDPSDASFSGLTAGQTTQIVVTYDVDDSQGGTIAQTATVTVTGSTDPVAVADSLYTTTTSISVDDFVLTANDTDVDSADTLFVSSAAPATGGYTVTDGTDEVTISGITGDGSFTYQTEDNNGGQNTGTVTVTYVNANTLTANSTNNIIIGGSGDETLSGLGGNDTLYGEGGDDSLQGGNGADMFFGGDGDDTLNGGSSSDTVNYSGKSAAVDVDLDTGVTTVSGGETDTLINIEHVIGSDHDDTIVGGGSDDNELEGGLGDDILTGNADADTFIYSSISDGNDTITDFDVGEADIIDLDELFDALGVAGDSRDEDVVLTDTGTDTVLTIDSQAGFSITLTGVDLDVTSETTLRAQINVGDES